MKNRGVFGGSCDRHWYTELVQAGPRPDWNP